MAEYITIGLVLLGLVILDGSGDAFRSKGWQILHHTMETIQIAGWILIWALFGFEPYYVAMYVLGRIWAFDLTWNLWTGNRILYVGTSDLFGRAIRGISNLFKVPYENTSFIIKLIAVAWWIAWLLTNGG
jgi:hypothetical protein